MNKASKTNLVYLFFFILLIGYLWLSIDSLAQATKKVIDFSTYSPPQTQGVVIKRQINPKAKKTIIYVVDRHTDETQDPESLEHSKQVQKQLYFIIKDMVTKFGKLPLVLEGWVIGRTVNDITDSFIQSLKSDGVPFAKDLERIFKERDSEKKVRIAEQMLGKTVVPMGILLALVFNEINMLGSVTASDIFYTDQMVREYKELLLSLQYPAEFLCTNNFSINFETAFNAFQSGDRSKAIVDCYCYTLVYSEQIASLFIEDRYIKAARKEIEAALNYEGDFVCVQPGSFHLPEALRFMNKKKVNYLIIAPKLMENNFPKAFEDPPRPVFLEDDEAGTCSRWAASLRRK